MFVLKTNHDCYFPAILGFWICLQTCQKILFMSPVSIVCYLKKYQIVPRSE